MSFISGEASLHLAPSSRASCKPRGLAAFLDHAGKVLANTSMSTAPTFTGAGAALSFMVTPPLQVFGRKPVNSRRLKRLRSLLWTY
jgi:hypothetical protein